MKPQKLYRCPDCGEVITDEDWETDPVCKHIGRCYCRFPTTDKIGKRLSIKEGLQQDFPIESLSKYDVYILQSSLITRCPICGATAGEHHDCPEYVHSSISKAKRETEGYDSVRELFEDNYHEDPIYKSEVNTGTEMEEEE